MAETKQNFDPTKPVNLVDLTCEQVDSIYQHMLSKNMPEIMWTVDIQKFNWEEVRDAHKNGQKLVGFGDIDLVELALLRVLLDEGSNFVGGSLVLLAVVLRPVPGLKFSRRLVEHG